MNQAEIVVVDINEVNTSLFLHDNKKLRYLAKECMKVVLKVFSID